MCNERNEITGSGPTRSESYELRIGNEGCKGTLATLVLGVLVSLWVLVVGGPALAHSFSLAIVANGTVGPSDLRSAVQGALTASAENDGHSDETADGHLGGLDVFLIPLPEAAAQSIEGLVGSDVERLDFLVALGGVDLAGFQGVTSRTIVLNPGDLPNPAIWTGPRTPYLDSFSTRYQRRFGAAPDAFAAQGYFAARKIDHAVRESGGISNMEVTQRVLDASRQGIDW